MELTYEGKVAIVTGAGAGLGRVYAMQLAERGAKVVVNDLGGSTDGAGASSSAADDVVNAIKAAGGEAVANYDSCVDGEKIVKTAIDSFGRIDILINNAGILRDVSFAKMTEKDYDMVMLIHAKGTYSTCKAAWSHMRDQEYGRIVNVTSSSGLYGNFGQSNYSAAKMAIVGLTSTLAKEGAKKNIKANILAPGAGSRMTAQVMPPEMVEAWKPEFVSPMALFLAHEDVPTSAGIFEAGGGWFSQVTWQRSDGLFLPIDGPMSPEDIKNGFDKVQGDIDFSKAPDQFAVPAGTHKSGVMTQVIKLMQDNAKSNL
jgi:multifunctional beta-oxidation protein